MIITVPFDIGNGVRHRHKAVSHCCSYSIEFVLMGQELWCECKLCNNRCNPVMGEERYVEERGSEMLHRKFQQDMDFAMANLHRVA